MKLKTFYLTFCMLFMTSVHAKINSKFGGWSISSQLYEHIGKLINEGDTILELGSGWASGELSKKYAVYSVEHDLDWLNRYNTNYIFAPISKNWYHVDTLEKKLPKDYDLILIDGPPSIFGRSGFVKNFNLFKPNVPMIFDDVNRISDFRVMNQISEILDRPYKIYNDKKEHKKYGIILP